jgi:hypothetical protein
VGEGLERLVPRLHEAFPFPEYPSISLSAVLVTQSKLSPSRLTYPIPADRMKYVAYLARGFGIYFAEISVKSRIL